MTKQFLMIFFLLIFSNTIQANQNVLFIHSYDTNHKWVQFISEGFERGLSGNTDVNIFTEYMDAKRFPKGENQELFYKHLLEKYQDLDIKAVVVSDDPAMNLMLRHEDDIFHSVPLVYMGVNRVSQQVLDLPNATGVFENRDLESTMVDIKRIFDTDNIIVISDQSSTGVANLKKVQDALGKPNIPKHVEIITSLNISEISGVFKSYSSDIPVFIVGQLINDQSNNSLMKWTEGVALLSSKIPNPLISIGIVSLEHGAIGAHELSGQQHALKAADLLLQILEGKPVEQIKPITKEISTWYFNWQEMKQHSLPKKALPKGSLLMFEDESFYEQNQKLVIGFSITLLVALVIIVLLLELVRRSKQTQKILKENESRYRDLALEGAHVFWETDTEDKVKYISGDTVSILAIENEYMQEKTIAEVIQKQRSIQFPLTSYFLSLKERKPLKNVVARYTTQDKAQKIIAISGKPLYSDNNQFMGYRGIIKEITDEHRLTEKIAYEASHDSLTGLINRRSFNERCREISAITEFPGQYSFICFLDLDRFKMVNDTIGHMAGDGMLAELARVIKNQVEANDILGRIGGDEFGLILKSKSPERAQDICTNIINSVSEYRLYWNNSFYSVGVSIGMVKVDASLSYQEMLSHADIACYKAKEQGRGRLFFSSDDDSSLLEEQMQLGYIANINHALEDNQFFFAKQLIKPLSDTGGAGHYEILLRYNDKEGNPIPPGMFIPAAEKYGVITLVDLWVIRTVITHYDDLFKGEQPVVSINISGISLSSEEFTQNVIQVVESASLDMRKVCFEITETAVISHIQPAQRFIQELKKYGCKFSLDDFGSGSSSYGYLKTLPVDYLKIDGSLIKSIATEKMDQTIVKSINEIAHSVGIRTVAEFVENDEIISILRDIGVDYGQGYGIHKPEII
ncbi:EAL domain-containing protein [Vibrio hannami]|uniref:EAL domain-containing protein n=1 Tax=Vibrio hannami TaxID=2717094 RepID=UPI002410703B|nr:EAL domain-containing protein [Vibrio hannami]MDG3086059.1 EAL domain-containing protein [Vibrio hannami]